MLLLFMLLKYRNNHLQKVTLSGYVLFEIKSFLQQPEIYKVEENNKSESLCMETRSELIPV